jgi:hypothetical protein
MNKAENKEMNNIIPIDTIAKDIQRRKIYFNPLKQKLF